MEIDLFGDLAMTFRNLKEMVEVDVFPVKPSGPDGYQRGLAFVGGRTRPQAVKWEVEGGRLLILVKKRRASIRCLSDARKAPASL